MLLPVTLVVLTGIVALILDMIAHRRNNHGMKVVTLAGLAIAAASIAWQFAMPGKTLFDGMIVRDEKALMLQLLVVIACFLSVLFSEGYLKQKQIPFGEFYPLAAWSSAGGMIMVSTDSMLMLFIGLEVLSIPFYVMVGLSRKEAKAEEAALKYFLLGAFATAILLYGLAFMFGASGSLRFSDVGPSLAALDGTMRSMLVFGMGLALIGLCFKAAFVPFHQWTPDAYEGAPTNVTAFMASASKIAAFGALYRFLDGSLELSRYWFPVLFWVAILTIALGNLAAIFQKDVRRILGYSSISNAGYVLVALLAHYRVPDQVSLGTTIFFLIAYNLMTVGAFAVVSLAARNGRESTRLEDLHGMWRRNPTSAALLIVFIASLIGVPPTAGFFGKFLIFNDALRAGLMPLAVVLALGSVVSVYYYLQIVRATFVSDETSRYETAEMNFGLRMTCVVCAVGILIVNLFLGPIFKYMEGSKKDPVVATSAPLGLDGARASARP
jgi:NADH-quinone oxidoreductase subunit N